MVRKAQALRREVMEARKGLQFEVVAEFDEVVTDLKFRNGRLTAKVGGIWHIIPDPKPTTGK